MHPIPSIIIIGGCCCSGKTSIGKALADNLSYKFYDADDFHSLENKLKMSRGQPLTDHERIPWINDLNFLLLNTHATVLACSALKKTYRDRLTKGLSSYKIFMLNVPQKILYERIKNRVGHYAKEESFVDSQLAVLEVCDGENDLLQIDGSAKQEETLSTIKQLLFQ